MEVPKMFILGIIQKLKVQERKIKENAKNLGNNLISFKQLQIFLKGRVIPYNFNVTSLFWHAD